MGLQAMIPRFARRSTGSRRLTRIWFAVLSTTMIAGQAVVPALVQPASAALSTNFFDYQNHDVATAGAGLVDWANNGALTSSNALGSTWSRAGSQGLFNGGVYNGGTKPPTAPGLTAAGLALKAAGTMESSTFVADPISSDTNFSCQGPSGPVTVSGDPTTFAGAGSETNNGQLSTFTYGSSGNTPAKDDLSNIYAISHNTASANEIFFGGERIVNNGASHIDFEFLQATLTVPNPCAAGTMSGHRTQRDLLLSTDFTNGGALSGSQLYSWSCNGKAPGAAGYDASKDFTVCDPAANGNPGNGDPQYVAVTDPASSFGVNTGANGITCGGWVCRAGSGTGTSTLLTNAFMEGGIDLNAAGFTGCISTFLPHTRSSPSFTSVLKDFAGPIAFSNCKTPTVTTQQSSAGVTSGANITIGLGASVTDTAILHGPAAHVGGTVAYKLFSDANCTTQVGSTSTKAIDGSPDGNGDLVLPTSDAITPLTAGTYYWTAAYSGDTATGGQNNSATSACGAEVLTVSPPVIHVAKTADAASVSSGTAIGFTVTVSNSGLGTATGVTLTDALPGGNALTPVHWTIDGTTGDFASFAITGADGSQQLKLAGQPISLAPSASLTVHVTAATSATSCTTYDNSATIAATNNPTVDPATASEIVNCPKIAVDKTADAASVSAGTPIGFTVTVSNPGPGNATGVTLTDALPGGNAATPVHWTIDGTTGDPASFAISGADGAQHLTLAGQPISLASLASLTVHVTAATSSTSCAAYDNTASATTTNDGSDSHEALETVNCPNLTIVKTADHQAPVSAGTAIGFTVTVSNSGLGTAAGATLTDPLPAGDGVSWSIDAGDAACSIAGSAPSQTLNCTFGDIAPAASKSVHVTSATSAASCKAYDNSATVAATNNQKVDPATASETVNCPDVAIVKTSDAASVSAGTPIGFTVTVSNSGSGDAAGVTLTDALPGGNAGTPVHWSIDATTGDPASFAISGADGSQQLTLAGQPVTLTADSSLTVHVTAATSSTSCATYDNSATIAATNNAAVDPATASEIVNCPLIHVNKTADHEGPVSAGTSIGFTVTVSNSGSGNATGVTLTDALPGGNAANPVHWTIDGTTGDPASFAISGADGSQQLTLAGQPISLAALASLTVHVTAATSSTSCAAYDNTAHVTTTNDGSDSHPASETVDCPNLAIVKTADHQAPVSAGTSIGFTVSVSNAGPGTATGVTVIDPLPGGDGVSWTIDAGDEGCSISGSAPDQTLTCTLGDLGANASASVHVTSATTAASCKAYDNSATVVATNNPAVVSLPATETVNCPDVAVAKTADHEGHVSAGTSIGFRVTVSNSGLGDATGVTLTDALPGGNAATPVHWTIDGATGDPASFAITGADGSQQLTLAGQPITLTADSSLTVHMTATTSSTSCTTYDNSATVAATNNPTTIKPSGASETVDCPSLTINKTADFSPVNTGDPIGFTILVSNSGPGTATAVVLNDPLPAGNGVDWSISPADPACSITGTAPDQVLVCSFGDLAADDSVTVHIASATTAASGGRYDNTATASADNHGPVFSSAFIVVQPPVLSITKVADAAEVTAGSAIGFTIKVANGDAKGTGIARAATLSDPLPGHSGVSWSIDPAYAGPGTCSITGTAPHQTLNCSFGDMAPGAKASVHVTSATTAASVGDYPNTATVSATNGTPVDASATTSVIADTPVSTQGSIPTTTTTTTIAPAPLPLPFTGSSAAALAAVALVLMATGGTMALSRRRRRALQ